MVLEDDLARIVKAIKKVCQSEDITPSDDTILECAMRRYNAEHFTAPIKEKPKGPFESPIAQEEPQEPQADNRPTDKQIAFLKRNKIAIRPDLTKQEAHKIIEGIIERQGKR